MNDDIREIYDADTERGPAPGTRRVAPVWDAEDGQRPRRHSDRIDDFRDVEVVVQGKGSVLGVKGGEPDWDSDKYERATPMDAYADGWMAYCESEDESPYRQLDLRSAWEDGWADAEDFYGGEPCH